jgi:hypothetical protein
MNKTEIKENPSHSINLFFNHVKEYHEHQIQRFRALDTKSSTLLNTDAAIIALILVGFSYLFGKDAFIKNHLLLIIDFSVFVICLLLLFISGWFAVLTCRCSKVLDVTDPFTILNLYAKKYKNENETKVMEVMSVNYAESTKSYVEINKKKAKYLSLSQSCLKWSLAFLILFIIVLAIESF